MSIIGDRPARASAATLLLWIAAHTPALAVADVGYLEAEAIAGRCVFQVADHPDQRHPGHGSAVLLEVDRPSRTLTLATCAHVVAGLERPTLFMFVPGEGNRLVGQVTAARFEWEHDLAILEGRWVGPDPWLVRLAAAPPAVPGPGGEDKQQGLRAFAAGHANFKADVPTVLDLRLLAFEEAAAILPVSPARAAAIWPVRLTSISPTAAGMSGGLVIDEHGAFAGLVLGRIPDAVSLVLPAHLVDQAWKAGVREPWKPDPRRWEQLPYTEKVVKLLQAFEGDDGLTTPNALRWRDSTRLLQYFRDPGPLRELFQEVTVDPRAVFVRPGGGEVGHDLALVLDPACFAGDGQEALAVWVNGAEPFNGRPPDPTAPRTVPIGRFLVPGENLVILRKYRSGPRLGAGGRIEVDRAVAGLMADSELAVTLIDTGSRGRYRIERSLPGLVDGYAIYLTIRREPEPAPADARLEIDLDWAAGLLAARPIVWDLRMRNLATGSSARGRATILGDRAGVAGAVQLQPAGPVASQTLEVSFPATFELDDVYLNLFGIQARQEKLPPIRLSVKGRLQWVKFAPPDGAGPAREASYALCPRLVSARREGEAAPIPLEVGGLRLGLDIGPIAQEIAINHVNSVYLRPDEPRSIVQTQLRSFFLDAANIRGAGGAATPAFARVGDGRMTFGFSTGDRGRLPAADPWLHGAGLRFQAESVTLDGDRVRAILGDRIPEALRGFLTRPIEGVSGVAWLDRGAAPAVEVTTVRGDDFDPVREAYKALWEARVRDDKAQLALSMPGEVLAGLVRHLAAGRAAIQGLAVEGEGAMGHRPLLVAREAGAATVRADALSVPPEDPHAVPRVAAQAPVLRLEPIEFDSAPGGRPRLTLRGTLSAESLTIIPDANRSWGYQAPRLALRAEFPGEPGEDCALTIESAEGVPLDDRPNPPLGRLRGRTIVFKEKSWGPRAK